MKNCKNLLILSLFVMTLLFSACTTDDVDSQEQPTGETINTDSPLANLLIRSSQGGNTNDNIIDGNSCTTVLYPVTVFANGQKVIVESEADLVLIQNIFDQFPNDTDTLEIVYPFTVLLDDFTELTISSEAELQDLINACTGNNDPIECVDFVYPITFFVFDANQNQTDTVTVNNDVELFLFLTGLSSDTTVSINFPIEVILSDGNTVEVNNNQELQDIIANCTNTNDDPVDVTAFEENLTTGVWYVTYFFDDFDETSDFAGYEFTFNTDNTAQATNGSNNVNGTWNLTSGSTPDLDLFFGENDPFDELDEDWDIIEANENIIRLKDISGGDGSTDFLTFERTPNNTGNNETLNQFIDNLITDAWFITLYNDDGDDETCDYAAYQFNFDANGTTTATSDSNTVTGFWSAQASSSGIDLILNYNFTNEDDPFEDLNDDWDVIEFDGQIIRLTDVSGGNGGTDFLNFGREAAPNCDGGNSAQELTNIMQDGQWLVASYIDDGDDETGDYTGYTLTFNANGTVVAANGSNTINGTWSITGGSSDLDFNMDFGANFPFDEFNDDWDVQNFITTRVELQDVSGGNGGTDTLVFEKI
jgi:heat shock protein HslJ